MIEAYSIQPLAPGHDRGPFACGVAVLDRYLQTQAGQDVRRRVANCFVAVADDGASIAGYYTLAASSIPMSDLPIELAGRLPRYPLIPAALLGRLAIDRRHAGRGLGSALLYDAMTRAAKADPAVFALIVDAKDDTAAAFYSHFGFRPFPSKPMSLFLPTATVIKMIER